MREVLAFFLAGVEQACRFPEVGRQTHDVEDFDPVGRRLVCSRLPAAVIAVDQQQ